MRKIVSLMLTVVIILSAVILMPVCAGSYTPGDLNTDGNINAKDSIEMKRVLLGSAVPQDIRTADLNYDGKVNPNDSIILKRVILGVVQIEIPQETLTRDITEYTVVYPENATVYEKYAAELLCDFVRDNCQGEIAMTTDSAAEVQYEILIGDTNRSESVTAAKIASNQYMVQAENDKIVLQGRDYMIGGAVGELTYSFTKNGKVVLSDISETEAVLDWTPAKADSVILMIGDGMGFNHIAFAVDWMQYEDVYNSLFDGFIASTFPNCGECTTLSITDFDANNMFGTAVTDSAAAATALATGWKTQNGKLGINGYGMSVQNVRELAQSKGLKTAVVSTEPLTGATPSAFTVHNSSRANSEEIFASQQALIENGEITYLKGGVYNELLNETKTTLDIVSTDSDGFYVMIEEAYIDKAVDSSYNGGNNRDSLARYVCRFNDAIQYAATFTAARPGTVLIVTADHETGDLSTSGESLNNGRHSDKNVPVFAMGAGCEMFGDSVVDNTDIADFCALIFGAESFGGTYPNMK